MPSISALEDRLNRVTNRLIRRFPRPMLMVRPPRPIVTFTFDDVPDTALSAGAAILEAHGVRGTFYIAGGLVGQEEPTRRLITADGCAELARRGHELGCHTFSHANVRRLGRSALAADLDRNDEFLTAVDGPRQRNFAFPYNAMSLVARSELRRRFATCRASGEGINRGPLDPLLVKGVEIRPPEAYADGLVRWIDAVTADPGWLVFFTHDVGDTPTPYGVTPRALDRLVGEALSRGAEVLTVEAARRRFEPLETAA